MKNSIFYRTLSLAGALCLALLSTQTFAQGRKSSAKAAPQTNAKAITIRTEPNAIVWIDEVRRGTTDASGKLTLTKISAGRHTLRVRASGFKEVTTPLLPAKRGDVPVRLTRTTDEAELAYQQAEEAREKARDDEARKDAVQLYRRAIQLRPEFAAAHLGLARALMDQNNYKAALVEVTAARDARTVYPEASAVEGRILRELAFEEKAIESFRRSIREARGFQPEAHTGLARVLEEQGQNDEAVSEYRTAIAQLSDSEPVLYQLLGALYEKQEKYKEAVAAYEKYLQLAPEGTYASALRSILDQLRKQAAGDIPLPNP
ncbi:MAG: tetratricopeptide repeat protein [Pyrinomonadaceae bacterium]